MYCSFCFGRCKLIGSEKPPTERFYIEMNLRNQKRLISSCYNVVAITNLMIGRSKYGGFTWKYGLTFISLREFYFLGDLNAGMEQVALRNFYNSPSFIDLIRPKYFQTLHN